MLKKRLRLRGLVRAVWQRRLQRPHEWRSLHQWETQYCPHHLLQGVHNPARQRQSWSYIHSAIYQFCQYETIVTDRLHGHILCTLLNIPHVFLPNSYHKNASFYRHWTAAVPSSVFAETVEAVPEALAQLNAAQRESDQGGKGG